MNRKNAASLGITLLCTVLILGIGYTGIVKGGRLLLSNEEAPQKAEFENTGSNIFYGKIEDDIQLYPWNYYGQNELTGTVEEVLGYPEIENIKVLENILRLMEAYSCNVSEERIQEVYEQKGTGIVDSMKISDTGWMNIFFYQDILEINGKRYQVKIACDEWGIQSFSCMEYRENDVRQTAEWEEGKKLLTQMLEKYQYEIAGQLYNMKDLYLGAYNIEKVAYAFFEQYLLNMKKLENIMEAVSNGTEYKGEEWNKAMYDNGITMAEVGDENGYVVIGESGNYSCQMIELNDMILLLIQGDYTIGLFYDPINQKFCGYNYFPE